MISRQYNSREIGTVCFKQPSRFVGRNIRPGERAIEYASDDWIDHRHEPIKRLL
jgi:hypothetical protein